MSTTIRIAVAQINTIVGDIAGNRDKILFCINEALEKHSDLIVFPELTVTGYPPEDLLLRPHFIKENLRCLNRIASSIGNIIAIIGFVDEDSKGLYNSAAVINNKKLLYVYRKRHLPNYGVFDEKRYFKPGIGEVLLKTKDFSFAVNICEDMWVKEDSMVEKLFQKAQFLINISASPYHLGKIKDRKGVLSKAVKRYRMPIVYCNLIGGQDELVFDGRSLVLDRNARAVASGKAFEEDIFIVDLAIDTKKGSRTKKIKFVNIDYKTKDKKCRLPKPEIVKDMDSIEEVYSALVLGVRDYVRKNNFKLLTFGLSGGIDSALVACISVDALGKANVLAISMPSRYSSKSTQDDAEIIAKNLGIRITKVTIDTIFDAYMDALSSHFIGMGPDVTEENIQARIRGNILMAFSNKFGYLLLNTGNKSETSVGYCTLYGDMAGGFAVIKDVPKDIVYELARFVNKKNKKEVIPISVFERAPSAELKDAQNDQDTLPPYEILDEIIDLYIEKNNSFIDILKKVKDKNIVRKVLRMIDLSEYKRRQAPPGIKITPMAFGKDRRMPITNKFMEAIYESGNR